MPVENKQTTYPVGDKMHNWAFEIADWGLEIQDWGLGNKTEMGWNRLDYTKKKLVGIG